MAATDPTGFLSIPTELIRGLDWKRHCRVATTANITIATGLNAGDTIDGVTLADGDRVLVKDQTTASQNGIYIAGATPVRAFDMDQDLGSDVPADEVRGAVVLVLEGTVNAGTLWRCGNTAAATLDSTALTFIQIQTASALTVKDEGTPLATAAASIDFVGDGVVASGTTSAKTVTIAGVTEADVRDAGRWEPIYMDGEALLTDSGDPVLMWIGG